MPGCRLCLDSAHPRGLLDLRCLPLRQGNMCAGDSAGCLPQGHIALDQAVFPSGTPGLALDTLARAPLWSMGLNYRHGTGHGVGAALNVHEGPQSISHRCPPAPKTTPSLPSMAPWLCMFTKAL